MNSARKLPKSVNVASVPQRSPFRYPGGKTWLVPYLRAWMKSLSTLPGLFVEPFAGGGIISLTVAFEGLAKKVDMTELDSEVAAVWQAMLGSEAELLAERIRNFDISIDNVVSELAKADGSLMQCAFNTILKNRTYHGGILAEGSGFLKHGENGKGIRSRWYPETLSRRILAISTVKSLIQFNQGDGIERILELSSNPNNVFFIDPPYTAGSKGKRAGRRLYKHFLIDHEMLFDSCSKISGDFLMTYDNDKEVLELAKKYHFDTEIVPMRNTHHVEMVELLIGKNLDWARRMLFADPELTLFDFEQSKDKLAIEITRSASW